MSYPIPELWCTNYVFGRRSVKARNVSLTLHLGGADDKTLEAETQFMADSYVSRVEE